MNSGGGRRRRYYGDDSPPPKHPVTWFGGSPLAVATLGITLALNAMQIGYTYAVIKADLAANTLAITIADSQGKERDTAQGRLIEERHLIAMRTIEDRHQSVLRANDERHSILVKSIDRLESGMSGMLALKTDVEVVKNKLTGIDETLRRVERSWDRAERSNAARQR